MAAQPTIRDVSRLADVSVSTVSAVINNKTIVHPRTKRKVEEAIRKLNYTPSRMARTLASGKTGNVGFILAEQFFNRSEPFYTRVFMGAEFEARRHDLYILLTTIQSPYRGADDLPRFIHERNVEGVIVAGRIEEKPLRDIKAAGMPVVLVDYGEDDTYGQRVLMNNRTGTAQAVRHLIELGHREIGYIGGEMDHPSAIERFQGYEDAMKEAGLDPEPRWIDLKAEVMTVEEGSESFERLLQAVTLPSAVVCSNDAMAIGVMRTAQNNNLSIPQQLSVIGFDDVAEGCLLDPPLTTLRVAKEDLGAIALQSLVGRLNNEGETPKEIRVDVEFVPRGTTAPPVKTHGR
jgi:LacI family transcriptional regulator